MDSLQTPATMNQSRTKRTNTNNSNSISKSCPHRPPSRLLKFSDYPDLYGRYQAQYCSVLKDPSDTKISIFTIALRRLLRETTTLRAKHIKTKRLIQRRTHPKPVEIPLLLQWIILATEIDQSLIYHSTALIFLLKPRHHFLYILPSNSYISPFLDPANDAEVSSLAGGVCSIHDPSPPHQSHPTFSFLTHSNH